MRRTCTSNGLPVSLVLNIASSIDTLDVGQRGAGLGGDVSVCVGVDLALDEGGCGVVANGVEQTV